MQEDLEPEDAEKLSAEDFPDEHEEIHEVAHYSKCSKCSLCLESSADSKQL